MVWLDEGGRRREYARLIASPASLAPWVEHFWIQKERGPAPERPWRIVADFCGHLVFTFESRPGSPDRITCSVVGSRAVYADIGVARRRLTIGARLRVGALAQLTQSRADVFTGRAFKVEDVFGSPGRALTDRMSNSTEAAVDYLTAFLNGQLSSREADLQLQRAMQSACSVASLAGTLNISLRAAYTRTAETAGLSPRRLLRIMRLHRALHHATMPPMKWSETAYLAGFADQAHLVREFRALLGDSPNAWRARSVADSFNTEAGLVR